MTMKIPFRNPYYRFASGYSFLFFISWSLWWSLYAIWLKRDLGLTGAELGTLYSVNQFTSMLFMVVYGVVQDRLGLNKRLIWGMCAILVLTGPFIIYLYEPLLQSHFSLGLVLGSVFFGLGYLAGNGLLDSFMEKMSRAYDFEYGTSRAWGSLGYAAGALCAGVFFSINPHINFWLVSLCGALFMLINIRFRVDAGTTRQFSGNKVSRADFIGVFKDVRFWVLVLFIVGTWSFYTIYDQQLFPVFYAGLFDSPETGARIYGYLNAFQVVLEALSMAMMPFFINRIGPRNGLLLSVMIMMLRILSCAIFSDPWIISLVKLLHAIEVPLGVISVFKYAITNFDRRLSSTIYLVGFQIASSVGIVALSLPVGMLFDAAGYQTVFYTISAVIFVLLIFGAVFLSRQRECPEPGAVLEGAA
ncbi:oligosaccharide MFS transporter [Pluralibacter gergoviae]